MKPARRLPDDPLDVGLRFELHDADFEQWWYYSLLREEAEEFVNLYAGSLEQARFVCALDRLTNVDQRALSAEIITRCYIIARRLPHTLLNDPTTRHEAQVYYNSDAVTALIDRMRSRQQRESAERIRRLTVTRIEKLFDKTDPDEVGTDASEHRLALDASLRYLTLHAKERAAEDDRRDKRALVEAMQTNRERIKNVTAAPTIADAKQFVAMLRDVFPPDQLAEIMAAALPPPPAE